MIKMYTANIILNNDTFWQANVKVKLTMFHIQIAERAMGC